MAIQYNCLFPGIAQKTYLQVGLETSRQNPIEQQNCYLQEIKLFIGPALNVVYLSTKLRVITTFSILE